MLCWYKSRLKHIITSVEKQTGPLTMGEQAVHLSKAKLAGRTLSNLERKPRICGEEISTLSKNNIHEFLNNEKHWRKTVAKSVKEIFGVLLTEKSELIMVKLVHRHIYSSQNLNECKYPSWKWTENKNFNHLFNSVYLVFIRLEHPLVSESQQPFL